MVVVAVLLGLGVGAAGIIYSTYPRPAAALTDRDLILLADYENRTSDPRLGEALKAALAYQLQQSPFLKVVSDDQVQRTLVFMKKPRDARLTSTVAREVCQRAGIKAMVAGSLDSLGTSYSLTLHAVNCATGDTIAMARAEAGRVEELTKSQDKAVSELRGGLGESLGSIKKYDVPTEATTASLEALQLLDRAESIRSRGNEAEAVPILQRAVTIDPSFGLAWARLSAALGNSGKTTEGHAAASRAFELKDRVSDRERFYIVGRYYRLVTRQRDQALAVFREWATAYPRDDTPWNHLSIMHAAGGDYEQAVGEARNAVQLEPTWYSHYVYLAWLQLVLGQPGEAEATLRAGIEHQLDAPMIHFARYVIAISEGDPAAADAELGLVRGKPEEGYCHLWLAEFNASRGRLREAREQFERARRNAELFGLKDDTAAAGWELARVEAAFGNLREARARAAALEDAPDEPAAVLTCAMLGDGARLEKMTGIQKASYPQDKLMNELITPVARAALEIQRGKPEKALNFLSAALPYQRSSLTAMAPPYYRGQALLITGRPAEAAAEFQKVFELPVVAMQGPYLALAHIGLARARAKAGDIAGSRQAYENFFAFWKDADPDILILQEAKREYQKLASAGR
jgi:tetratricopeptide (TPR) repeat protein